MVILNVNYDDIDEAMDKLVESGEDEQYICEFVVQNNHIKPAVILTCGPVWRVVD